MTIEGDFCEQFIDGRPPMCMAYDERPACCRDYPQPGTRLDPGCGFRFVKVD